MIENPEKFPQTSAELGEFVRKNQDKLVRHAFFRLGDREEAEDVVQEVMIRMFQEKERKEHVEQATSYVFRMVFNTCLDRLRKRARDKSERMNGTEVLPADGSNREAEIIAREEFLRINRLLDSIPFEQAEVLRLRIIDEMSFTEIAEVMRIPVTTIKSRFSYGMEKLRNRVDAKVKSVFLPQSREDAKKR
jgi:RNA polymerase sigma-70 factor (ECF subfamily)